MSDEHGNAPGGEVYEIRLQGRLDRRWFDWFDAFSVENLPTGEVVLRGRLVDQAALHGVLERIRDLNLKLISVNRIAKDR
jgi:hypothetical protein